MRELYQALKNYTTSRGLRLHMPGHKGIAVHPDSVFPYAYDVTELAFSDDLHCPEHIFKRLRDKAQKLWRADQAWLLTNGSTAGNLIGLHAALATLQVRSKQTGSDRTRVLVQRNSHRSVFHALNLARAKYSCFAWTGSIVETDSISRPLTLKQVLAEVDDCPEVGLVIFTWPDYSGLYPTDLASIVAALKEREILVYVDAAHGAHLNFCPDAQFALAAYGVDLFSVSLHKTLPAATSTAVLLSGSSAIEPALIDSYYDIFETSSPSYPLLLSLEDCLEWLSENHWRFTEYIEQAQALRQQLAAGGWYILDTNYPLDPFKINVLNYLPDQPVVKLLQLQDQLRRLSLEVEYANEQNLLLMLSPTSDFARLRERLSLLDWSQLSTTSATARHNRALISPASERQWISGQVFPSFSWLSAEDAIGGQLARDLFFYPPGVAYKLAGEYFTQQDCDQLAELEKAGLRGLKDHCLPIANLN